MQDAIQKLLDELTARHDPRVSVFDIQFKGLENGTLSLSGKILYQDQRALLETAFADHFPGLSLDTTAVRILGRASSERVHVVTNLTGLYEKPTFGMALSSELYFGTDLEVLDEQGKWVFARQRDGYLGWVYRSYLGEGLAPEATHLVMTPSIEMRSEPDEAGDVVSRLVSGTGVTLEETFNGWSRISAHRTGWLPASALRALIELPKTMEEKRTTLIQDSKRLIGIPYLWGGVSGNGIDCSGFARLLHRWLGIDIPRDADMQYDAAHPIEPPFEVGDLLFFSDGDSQRQITHVVVSLGDWRMIHASRGNNGVYMDDVQVRQSLQQNFVSAGSFLR